MPDLITSLAPVAVIVLGFILGIWLGTAAHELGHWLCAIAVSMPVRLVSIGRGHLLRRGRIGETQFDWHAVPISGVTICYPLLVLSRWRYAIFLLGGVIGNLALAATIILLDDLDIWPRWVPGNLIGAVFALQFLYLRNLLPLTERRRKLAYDGLLLWRLAFKERSGVTEAGHIYAAMLTRYSGRADQRPDVSGASPRLVYQFGRVGVSDDADTRREVHAAFEGELTRAELALEEELLVLDKLISDALIRGEGEQPSHLDRWSLRAVGLAPDLATIRGSRGACLVRLGRYLEGKALLAPLAESDMSMFDSVMTRAFLARAEYGLGDAAAARHWAASARELNTKLDDPRKLRAMLTRLEDEMGMAPLSA